MADDISVDDAPTDINPYFVLSLEPDASQSQIKSAYRKAALKHHPDKAAPQDKDEAHTKFQEIAFAYAVLSDENRRRRYDATGNTAESLEEGDQLDWVAFFRAQYADVVTEEKIEEFSDLYKGSEEERGHVLRAYTRHNGSMGKLYQEVMLSDPVDDEERFRGIIDAAIEEGRVEAFPAYAEETEKSKKARIASALKIKQREAKDAKKVAEELKEKANKKSKGKAANGDVGDLAALIQQRQKGRAENFFDQLEAKYAGQEGAKGKKKGSKRAAEVEEPPEEAFERNRKVGKEADGGGGGDARAGAGRTKRSRKA
ncbi:DnaJ-domain-containing protein [Teratosphaeria nubilosa]|uniref:DnaJ-domain-containing protein n=1 Tax=Teratosphaeria nubilosa TaxID=161662 RepID=A0A6G1KYZ0_9PEZI|nr:DnaJ-domain-containing protein [Teratosphaeria nubilosa]